jgi:hypothetical protein
MTFARTWPMGLAYGEILYSADLNALDSLLPYALDTRGGTYDNGAITLTGGNVSLPTTIIAALFRENLHQPWPQWSVLGAGNVNAHCWQQINVFDVTGMGADANLVLNRTGALDGNLQLIVRGSGSLGLPVFDTDTAHQVVVLSANQWALTQYRDPGGYVLLLGPLARSV